MRFAAIGLIVVGALMIAGCIFAAVMGLVIYPGHS